LDTKTFSSELIQSPYERSVMKPILVLLACVIALTFLNSCSDDDCAPCAPCPILEQPLAEYVRITSGGGSGGYDSLRITCHYTATTDTLFDIYVDESDEGYMLTIDESNNPDFSEAIALLTNGTDEGIIFWVRFPSGSGGGIGSNESYFIEGGFSGEYNPDLAGAEVTEIRLYMEDLYIDNQGDYTDYEIAYRTVFMGKP
jgi:hypothetical protein